MKTLKIGARFTLPLEAVTQTFAILAKRRVGKTYTASVMAEEFVAAGLPFVALDPTGAWWGLRAAADGKSEGLPVVIIGGAHGDVPLEATAGKVIADLVVEHPGFYVVDLSGTASNAEQDRFAMEFAERLYRRKEKSRDPLHLFIDEADSFAPQRPMPGQQRMLGAFEALVRRGGIRGIGMTLITQRPAVLNKNVLTQSEVLIALQINAPQDQDAIKDWASRNGTREQLAEMMASLASLETGEAWFWSPGWMRTFEKIQVRERRTFNSSATPKAGEKAIVPQRLAKVDIERLGKEIQSSVERAKENDPTALRRQVAELKQKLAKSEGVKPESKAVEVPVFGKAEEELLERAANVCSEASQKVLSVCDKVLLSVEERRQDIQNVYNELCALRSGLKTSHFPVAKHAVIMPPVRNVRVSLPRLLPVEGNGALSKCERSILIALAQYPSGRTASQAAILSGYSVNSGGFNNALSKLRTSEYISRGQPMQVTESGLQVLGPFEPLPVGMEAVKHWLGRLSKCEALIFQTLAEAYPRTLTAAEVAEATGYSVDSGGFNNSLSKLRTLELITRGQPMRASDEFFQ